MIEIKISYKGHPSKVVVENANGSERKSHLTYSGALADVAQRFVALEDHSYRAMAGKKAAQTRKLNAAASK
jgi:hypothetical protein